MRAERFDAGVGPVKGLDAFERTTGSGCPRIGGGDGFGC